MQHRFIKCSISRQKSHSNISIGFKVFYWRNPITLHWILDFSFCPVHGDSKRQQSLILFPHISYSECINWLARRIVHGETLILKVIWYFKVYLVANYLILISNKLLMLQVLRTELHLLHNRSRIEVWIFIVEFTQWVWSVVGIRFM